MAKQLAAHRRPIGVGVALLVFVLLLVYLSGPRANATHAPADKVTANGSTVEVFGPAETVTLLTATLKTSTTADLVLQVTAECSLVTDVTTVGNDMQSAFGQVKVWVELDGIPVLVSSDDTSDPGRVVFCNRAYSRTTSMFDDEDATIATFFRTRAANAFNWLAMNVGNGIHTITVKAELTEEATSNAVAEAAVGKRTLIIEPTKLANDASI
jgi:hypothetical protein